MNAASSTVLHVPHSSVLVPDDIRPSLTVSDSALAEELRVSTDWFTDELFAMSAVEATTIRFPVSRLVLDPERFLDATQEPLEAFGRGVVYTHMADGRRLRAELTSASRTKLIDQFYRPHHSELTTAVRRALDATNCCLLIDCHSFPSIPLPCDLDREPHRPDICLGTSRAHTPDWLLRSAIGHFESAGMSVTIDRPYAGVLVPDTFYGVESRVSALMIELNRKLYMDELTSERGRSFASVRATLYELLCALAVEARFRSSTV